MSLDILEFELADEAATERLGQRLASIVEPRDVLTLSGDLGMGKTLLARAFIGALTGETDVPSPTFTLVQTYDAPVATIWHFDLYRLKSPDEVWEIGLEEALADGILLIEWPDRMGRELPAERLELELAPGSDQTSRLARLSPVGNSWSTRLEGFLPL